MAAVGSSSTPDDAKYNSIPVPPSSTIPRTLCSLGGGGGGAGGGQQSGSCGGWGWVGESLKGFRHGNRLSHDDTAALYPPPRMSGFFFFYDEAAQIERSWAAGSVGLSVRSKGYAGAAEAASWLVGGVRTTRTCVSTDSDSFLLGFFMCLMRAGGAWL